MRVQCDSCLSTFKINENSIPEQGAWAKCKKCGKKIFIKPKTKKEKEESLQFEIEEEKQDQPNTKEIPQRFIKKPRKEDIAILERRQWRPVNAGLAAFLSWILPGAGQAYLSHFFEAILAFFFAGIGWICFFVIFFKYTLYFIPIGIPVLALFYLAPSISAYTIAMRINKTLESETDNCPFCQGKIRRGSIICKYCQKELPKTFSEPVLTRKLTSFKRHGPLTVRDKVIIGSLVVFLAVAYIFYFVSIIKDAKSTINKGQNTKQTEQEGKASSKQENSRYRLDDTHWLMSIDDKHLKKHDNSLGADLGGRVYFNITLNTSSLQQTARALKGKILVYDIFKDLRLTISVKIPKPVEPKLFFRYEGLSIDINPYIDNEVWFANCDKEDMNPRFEVEEIIYD